MEQNLELDNIITKNGKKFDETAEMTVNMNEDIIDNIDKHVGMSLAYNDAEIIPGKAIDIPSANDVEMEKEKADKYLLTQLAKTKMQKEKEAFNKLSDDEKIKNYIYDVEFYRQTNDFFRKNGYQMSGTQKRNLKRAIERAWKSGKYKLTQEQKDDILFELNKASNATKNDSKKQVSNIDQLTTLTSLINKA